MKHRVFIVFCTAPRGAASQALATALVEQQLAACVNVLDGVRSIYRWQGKIQSDEESLLLIKTTAERVQEISGWMIDNHPYEVPEVLALPVAAGLEAYLDWVAGSVGSESTKE